MDFLYIVSMKYILIACCYLATFPIIAQNLIIDPSIDSISCGTETNTYTGEPWYSARGSAEIRCDFPRTSSQHGGIIISALKYEYMSTKLKDTLDAGREYCVSFYARLADFRTLKIDSIGMNFSVGEYTFSSDPILVNPQISSPANVLIGNTYTEISGKFRAIGGESDAHIGNFNEYANISNVNDEIETFYFIDDVEVKPAPLIKISIDIDTSDEICVGDLVSVSINQDYGGINYFFNSEPVSSNFEFQVDAANNYIITAFNQCGSDTLVIDLPINCEEDTIKDSTSTPLPETNFFIPNVFSPNNDNVNDKLNIICEGCEDLTLEIYNVFGGRVFINTVNNTWDGRSINNKFYPQGNYIYKVTYTSTTGEPITQTGNILLIR